MLKPKNILVIHGPNLNLLGMREPNIYGSTNLKSLNKKLELKAIDFGCNIKFFQSNYEGEIIDKIQHAIEDTSFIIINPAGLTHTSIILRDCFLATKIPFIEVHISNIYAREEFRHKSYLADIAVGSISGLGILGYDYALEYAIKFINDK